MAVAVIVEGVRGVAERADRRPGGGAHRPGACWRRRWRSRRAAGDCGLSRGRWRPRTRLARRVAPSFGPANGRSSYAGPSARRRRGAPSAERWLKGTPCPTRNRSSTTAATSCSRRIGRGGMAEVFLARDQLLDRPVAIKVLFPEFAGDPNFVERFRREAQAAANLNHPNIVGVYDWGKVSGTYYIVMEYVDGRTVSDHHPLRRTAAPQPGRRHRRRCGVGAVLRPPQRRRAPRHQARQHPGHRPGGGEGCRLRHRSGHLRRRGGEPHPDRVGDGHRHLLLARAGPGPPRRPPQRPLLPGHRHVRDGLGQAPLLGDQSRLDRVQARPRGPHTAARGGPGHPGRLRVHHPPLAGQGPRRPVPQRRRPARRPAPLSRRSTGARPCPGRRCPRRGGHTAQRAGRGGSRSRPGWKPAGCRRRCAGAGCRGAAAAPCSRSARIR